jgi:uncharacterized membrane protein
MVLIPLLSLEMLTGVQFGGLWWTHYFIGFLLIPPVLLKMGSTGYRAARYYLRTRVYRDAGPPDLLGRVLGPLLVADVVVLFVSGVVMWAISSRDNAWSTLHTDGAVLFAGLIGVHLLLYLPAAAHQTGGELHAARAPADRWRGMRNTLLIGSLAAGVVLAAGAAAAAHQPPLRQHHHVTG